MKKKAMFSQPMAGKTETEIIEARNRSIEILESMGYEVINTTFDDDWHSKDAMFERGVVNIPMTFVAKSIENMTLCHAVFFGPGWQEARGCKIEHEIAKAYGVEIMYAELEACE